MTAAAEFTFACGACEADLTGEQVTSGAGLAFGQRVHLHDYGPGHSDVAAHPVEAGARFGQPLAKLPLPALAEAADSLTGYYAALAGPDYVTTTELHPFADAGHVQYWTDVSEWQGRAYNASYPHTFACYRVSLGTTYTDRLVAANTAYCSANAGPGRRLVGHMGYHVWYPGNNAAQLRLFFARILLDRYFVAMIDIESWSGQIRGDHSAEITAFAVALAGRLGNPKRVKVYGNGGDLASIYPNRPGWLGVIKASYGSTGPPEPWEAWQYSDGQARWPVPGRWPRSTAPFGAADHNARFDTVAGLQAAFGIAPAPPVRPPKPPTPPTPTPTPVPTPAGVTKMLLVTVDQNSVPPGSSWPGVFLQGDDLRLYHLIDPGAALAYKAKLPALVITWTEYQNLVTCGLLIQLPVQLSPDDALRMKALATEMESEA